MRSPKFVVVFQPETSPRLYANYIRGHLNHYEMADNPKAMRDHQLALLLRDMCADGLGGYIHIFQQDDEQIREKDDLSVTFP